MKRQLFTIILNLVVLIPAFAVATTYRVFPGVRALGMGETFVAVADEAGTLTWNPAGISRCDRPELVAMYRDLYGTGVKNHNINLLLPFSGGLGPIKNHGTGFNWSRVSFSDSELQYSKDTIGLSYGFNLKAFKPLSAGITLRYTGTDTKLDGQSLGAGQGVGVDVGLLLSLTKDLNIGLCGYDIGGQWVKYAEGTTRKLTPQTFRIGLAYRLKDRVLLAMDFDDRLHLGGEWWINRWFGVRGGAQRDIWVKKPETSFSLGASLKYEKPDLGYNFAQLDYAYLLPPTLPGTHYLSIKLPFDPFWNYKRAALKVVGSPILSDIYLALSEYYKLHPFGSIRLKNCCKKEKRLDVEISIFINDCMREPCKVGSVSLRPGETKTVSLKGLEIDGELAYMAKDGIKRAKLILKYLFDGKPVTKEVSHDFNLRSRFRVNFEEPAQLCAFVTDEDEVVSRFTRVVLGGYLAQALDEEKKLPPALYDAALVYEGLSAYRLSYQRDPRAASYFGDHVAYPRETLRDRRGDCDDLVVLYSSCLENLGIETCIIDVPPYPGQEGHVMMMLNTGVRTEESERISLDPSLFEEKDEYIWIPVEVTMLGARSKSFLDAWKAGAKFLREAQAAIDRVSIISVSGAWLELGFRPSSEILQQAEEVELRIKHETLKLDLEPRVRHIVSAFGQERRGEFESLLSRLKERLQKDPDDLDARVEIGLVYYKYGKTESAITEWKRVLEKDPNVLDVYFYLGDTYLVMGRFDEAIACYHTVLERSESLEDIADAHWQIGLCLWEIGQHTQAKAEFRQAVELDPMYGIEYDRFVRAELRERRRKREEFRKEEYLFRGTNISDLYKTRVGP
jgi:tetratricopeptide (TPR) repeat protein